VCVSALISVDFSQHLLPMLSGYLQNGDFVGVDDGRQSMCYDERRSALAHLLEGVLYAMFRMGIEGARGLIE